jgi:hypothetical protein
VIVGVIGINNYQLSHIYKKYLQFCPHVNTGSATAISAHGQISGQKSDNTISSLSINRSMHDFFHNRTVIIPQMILITHIHISLVSVWEVNFVLFNSMLKYVINRLMHAFFHFRTVIIHRPSD